MAVRRRAVRVLLLDPDDRLLLLQSFDHTNPARGSFWVTIGGGVEPGESDVDAALREVVEEVGIHDIDLGPLVAHYRDTFTFHGVTYDQANDYYLARTGMTEVDGSGRDEIEVRSTLSHRWWTVPELQASTDAFTCPGLGDLIAGLLRDGPPSEPIVLVRT